MVVATRCRGLLAATLLAITAATAAALTACSDSSEPPPETAPSVSIVHIPAGEAPLRVELIDEAIDAVEAERGGPQRYFEINATPTLVNVFVATNDATEAVAYVYTPGDLHEPAEPQPASGDTFSGADVAFDPDLVLAQVVAELPNSIYRVFSVLGQPSGGARYVLTLEAQGGSNLQVAVAADGTVLGIG